MKTKKPSKFADGHVDPSSHFPTTPSTDVGTPLGTTMDSDDEMMSEVASSQEEEDYGGTQDTDSGSVDDGMQQSVHRALHSHQEVATIVLTLD